MSRVLVDARLGWGSGIGRYVANLVPAVARLRAADSFDLLVNPADRARAEELSDGVANLAVRSTAVRPFSVGEQVLLPGLALAYDLTWFTNYWVPLRWRGRFVATVHDLLHLEPDLFPASRAKRALSRATFAKLARDGDALLFVSRFSRREFERRFGPSRAAEVVHSGIDHMAEEPAAPTGPGVSFARRVLVVAASKRHKNFGTALDAWRRARIGEGWTLTIVTPNEELRSAIDLAPLARAAGAVEIRQGVSDVELRALYRGSSIMLMPSRYEGFGFPLLEAMRMGALPISSTAAALVEIAQGASVSFVDPEDVEGWTEAIERHCRAFDEPGEGLAALLERNRRHASCFTWDRAAGASAETIGRVLDEPVSRWSTRAESR